MAKNTPPTWAPNAIATDRGWVDPKTNELLSSTRHLDTNVKYKDSRQIAKEAVVETDIKDVILEEPKSSVDARQKRKYNKRTNTK